MSHSTTLPDAFSGEQTGVKKRNQKTTFVHNTVEAFRFESIECMADGKKRRAYRSILRLIRQQLASATPRQLHASVAARPEQTASDSVNPLITSATEMKQICTLEPNTSSTLDSNPSCIQTSAEPKTVDALETISDEIQEMKIDDGSTIDDAGKFSNLSAEAVAAKLLELAPSVYEDPFCAVTADGTVHISEYYLVSDPLANAQRFSNHDKRSSKSIRICDIAVVFYANASANIETNLCRTFGLTRNSVWWAADFTRNCQTDVSSCWNVVLRCVETHPLQHGFTVVNMSAFIGALKACGLASSCHFVAHLPHTLQNDETLQFIDETNDELSQEDGQEQVKIFLESSGDHTDRRCSVERSVLHTTTVASSQEVVDDVNR
uniref:DSPn domain-containing protein n=1 Tax=Ascaris lumbricoides TaxID=6252 RepID=A0A0M3HUU1_ASCLU